MFNMVNKETSQSIFICDCCSSNFTVDDVRTDREYKIKCCPFCGNEYLAIKPKTEQVMNNSSNVSAKDEILERLEDTNSLIIESIRLNRGLINHQSKKELIDEHIRALTILNMTDETEE